MTPDQERDFIERQVNPDLSRRHFLEWCGKVGLGAAATTLFVGSTAACSKRGPRELDANANLLGDTIKVGVIAPFTGLGAFVGDITTRGLESAAREINSTGGIGGRKVELIYRDTGQDLAAGPRLYSQLLSDTRDLAGVLWCAGLGFNETLNRIKSDGLPVMAVFNDLETGGKLYPKEKPGSGGRSMFQFMIPTSMYMDVLGDYASSDRGYKTAALMYDKILDAEAEAELAFKSACDAWGLENVGVEPFSILDSDYGPYLNRLEKARPETLWISGISKNTEGIIKELFKRKADYVDAPTAKNTKKAWKPQVFGSPTGTGDKGWVELADADAPGAAKQGTLTVWHVGGLTYLPTFAIAGWAQKHLGAKITGGEESPADALATLCYAIKKAQTLDRATLVSTIETMGPIKFASIEFSFAPDRHLAKTRDDLVLVTMERVGGPVKTDPAYELGTEWQGANPVMPFPAGPTQLVRPTLTANQKAHPDVMKLIMDGKWGTHCTVDGGKLTNACKIH